MKTNIVKVRAMPRARTAHSARRVVVAPNTRAPTSQALHPRITVVLPLREMTIIKGSPQEAAKLLHRCATAGERCDLEQRHGLRLTEIERNGERGPAWPCAAAADRPSPWRSGRPRAGLTAPAAVRIKPHGYLTTWYRRRWRRTVSAPHLRPSPTQRGGPSWRGWRWVRPRLPSWRSRSE